MNGLIRQYIPKGTSLEDIDDEYIEMIQEELNKRPQKNWDY
jgi:IS30 family transposase